MSFLSVDRAGTFYNNYFQLVANLEMSYYISSFSIGPVNV